MEHPEQGESETIYIESGRDADEPGSCLLSWRGQEWPVSIDDVRATAMDLFTVAAWAEMMMHLLDKLGLDAQTMSRLMADMIYSRTGRTSFGRKSTFLLTPAGSSATKQPMVALRRRGAQLALTPGEARQMGLHWLEAAEGAESDQLVVEALRSVGGMEPDRIEGLFAYLRELRSTRRASA